MNLMGRREAVMSMMAGSVAAAAGIAEGSAPNPAGQPQTPPMDGTNPAAQAESQSIWQEDATKPDLPQNELKVSRIGPDGLEPIEWDDMKADDSIVIFLWRDNRIVDIMKAEVLFPPDRSKSGHPVQYKGFGTHINIRCRTRPDQKSYTRTNPKPWEPDKTQSQ